MTISPSASVPSLPLITTPCTHTHIIKEFPLLAVVGPVGAGKSTLLQCLLGELRPVIGSVEVLGSLSYANQEAWVFSGTVRENILFGQPYEPHWYNFVVEACALDTVSDGDLLDTIGSETVFWYPNTRLRHGLSFHSKQTLANGFYLKMAKVLNVYMKHNCCKVVSQIPFTDVPLQLTLSYS